MTTNKPEVKRYDCTSGGAQHCYGCYTMKECELGDYVEWEAHEALQAECSKALRSLEGLKYVAKVVSNYSDVVCEENKQLRVECEELRKDAERYRWITSQDGWPDYVDYAICEDGRKPVIDAAIDAAMETTK